MAQNPLLSQTNNVQTNSAFFRNLTKKAKVIADRESEKMAKSMVFILHHRQQFKTVGGQFPRWDGSNGIKSKLGFMTWQTIKVGDNWAITSQSGQEEYYYITTLVNGLSFANSNHPWHKAFYGGTSKRLTSYNGRIFSEQMPQGMSPWLKVKRNDLKKNILEAFRRGEHR